MAGIVAMKLEAMIDGLKNSDDKCFNAFNRVLDCNIEKLEKEIKSLLSYDFVADYQKQALIQEAEYRTYCSLNVAINMLNELERISHEKDRALQYLVDKRIKELHERYFPEDD